MQIASRQALWRESVPKGKTVLVIRASPESMTVEIAHGGLAPGSTEVTVDWGDGTVESMRGISNARHTYARAKDYVVKISDDISSFGYSASNWDGNPIREMLVELLGVGTKVTSIVSYGFNNCKNMRGVIELPNVTSVGSYAFGSVAEITDFILPSMTRLDQTSFYCGPSPTQLHADNVTHIDGQFWDYYGGHLADIYLRGSTRSQIRSMPGFPFMAGPTVRFHGFDGIVLGNGEFV